MVIIKTKRTISTLIGLEDAVELHSYFLRNANHLRRWEPSRSDDYHSLTAWETRANTYSCESAQGQAYRYAVRLKNENTIIGVVNFTNVVRGVFQACHLGFSLDEKQQGKGLMFESLSALIHHIFHVYHLHRVMANYMHENIKSGLLLKRLHFEKEGYAKDYLMIAGKWRDHILTSRRNDRYESAHRFE
ncbi:ribosomal protein S5-alanine N-acetyltransferase [Bartonella tribocorum]|uniref:30S ribosomal protein S5 alanine N-acetyltransferase n=1 Tax=Bartonella tribocorum TaxID=85701 RepID=A0A2M6UW01_9HYPH|nr:ribosomal protein S5-alanine N-acetyltransferase [Bartonella tribocorum]PIT70346.1 30S ribosomal protein S5 alanine N-acetyltransferase [Bartonella tribocorum]